ncbi:MAG: glycoside hydrolase family 27 protein [Haliscomenobacter sp.]
MRYLLAFLTFLFFTASCALVPPPPAIPSAPPPVMGWSSWNHFRTQIDENLIRAQVDALLKLGLDTLGYTFINIDDGYFGGRNTQGQILPHPTRFPHGMKALSDYIHSRRLKAGIYTDAGINTCASYWDQDTIGTGMGLFGHEAQDLHRLLVAWNFDFLKVDWCGGEWLGLDEQTRYTYIGRLARQLRPDVRFNVCRWRFPGSWVTQIADSWRISGDIANDFASVLRILDLNAGLWKYASPGHYNDMDMLQVGRGMTFEEDKTHFTFWCILQSPLLLGNDLRQVSPQTLSIIRNKALLDINQSTFVYPARRLVDYGDGEVWARPLVSTQSGEVVVALLNRSDTAQLLSVRLETLGINAAAGYTWEDLWTGDSAPSAVFGETIQQEVVPHGVVVWRIRGKALPYHPFQYDDKQER